MTHYIGLTGYPGAGKDTAADLLTEILAENGKTVYRTSFAKTMKEMLIAIDPEYRRAVGKRYKTPMDVLEYWKRVEPGYYNHFKGYTSLNATREKLQNLGQAMREINPQFWVDRTFREINDEVLNSAPDVVIITDVRYPNEVEGPLFVGGSRTHIWAIERQGKGPVNDHESERATREIIEDHTNAFIQNNGSIEDFKATLDDALGSILESV